MYTAVFGSLFCLDVVLALLFFIDCDGSLGASQGGVAPKTGFAPCIFCVCSSGGFTQVLIRAMILSTAY